jgi:hypothetical protein
MTGYYACECRSRRESNVDRRLSGMYLQQTRLSALQRCSWAEGSRFLQSHAEGVARSSQPFISGLS